MNRTYCIAHRRQIHYGVRPDTEFCVGLVLGGSVLLKTPPPRRWSSNAFVRN
jgi:hypothetical protein